MTRSLGPALILVLVLAAIAPFAAVGAAQEDTPTPSANETRHIDPDETNQDGDLLGVQSALAQRMAQRLSGSSVQLSQDQYDLANELVGQEYQDQYGKYVDVAGETDAEDRAESFETAQQRQQELVSDVSEYNQKYEEYQEARRNGNEERARRLARELDDLSEDISTTEAELTEAYTDIQNQSGVDMSEGSAAVNETVANVSERQEEIRRLEFEATTLTITARSDRVSFIDPLVLDGRLVTENGSAVADRDVVLRLNGRRLLAQTDDEGRFTAEYRPVTMPTGTSDQTVRYVPNATSTYLGSQANITFTVEQVDSTTTVETATGRVAFDEPVTASGRVTALGRDVPGVPVVLSVNGKVIARTNTSADGRYSLTGVLPASVQTGTQTLRVTVPLEGRAIGGSNDTAQMTVTETGTNLTLDTEPSASSIELTGRLATDDGDGVAGQQLEITRNGSVMATAVTGRNGSYSVTLSGTAEERYRVAVSYDEPTTNLENASASDVVTLPPGAANADGGDGVLELLASNTLAVAAAGLLLVLLGLGGGWWWLRESNTGPDEPGGGVEPAPTTAGAESEPSSSDPLAPARASVDENAGAAVERAYTTIRQRLHARGLGSDDATHWEFFRSCDAAGLEHSDSLETLTSLYERAAFDRKGVSETDAERALEQAARFV
ncbi:DUF4129 domain-containing protein [Halorarius litoreus]|uniref:DUF4129 domain-containing protein n=1 Tax=Halorarius litoreus TaxID=2962676 RepID=UPI0020CFDC65|nr:DUF4129 domain-containing protein [Halorarius litoreus]